jgi:hypothetical protein
LNGVVWRPAEKSDRALLERFCCTAGDGPEYEHVVQRYFRAQAIRHAGTVDSLRADHRLLLLFETDVLVGVACHRRGDSPMVRHLALAAIHIDYQGGSLTNGKRASDTLWEVVVNDLLARPGVAPITIVAHVHPDSARSLGFCSRIGLDSIEVDGHGLMICAGPLPPTPTIEGI